MRETHFTAHEVRLPVVAPVYFDDLLKRVRQ